MTNRFYNNSFVAVPETLIRSASSINQYESVELGFTTLQAELDLYWTEIANARQGQASLLANFARYLQASAGLTQNLPANGYRITGLGAPTASGDAATKGYVDASAFASALPAQSGNAGRVVRTDGATATWGDAWGDAVALTGTATLTARTTYHVDTSGGAFTANLPTATAGTWVLLRDVGRACAANPLTLDAGGANVYGADQDYRMDVSGETVLLIVDATKGWVRG